jgi:nucleotide-binding universal stress UspA family protein
MNKISKILVATDFSTHSDSAVLLGNEIQSKMGGEVTLIHISDIAPIWDLPATDMQARNLLGQFQKDIDASLEKSMREQMIRCKVQFESVIKFGNAQKELSTVIEATKADLLIMGHRGQTGFFGVGSFAEKMIATSPIPVLVTKNHKIIKTISCLIDPSRNSQDSIAFAQDLANSLNAKARFLTFIADLSSESYATVPFVMPSYKFSEQEKVEIIERAKSFITNQGNNLSADDVDVDISNQTTAKALTKGLIDQKADLAIVSKHNRGALERFFIGSTSKGVLQEFKGNILVLPA